MSYPWYQLPGRAVLFGWALGKSLWQDWFPRHCCETCEWSRDKGFTTLDCVYPLGDGYAKVVWKDSWCKHWKKRT